MRSNVDFLEYSLAVNPYPILFDKERKIVINTINQYSYCIAEKDPAFKQALQASDILLPDGIGIVKACSYLTGQVVKKISGADMHQKLLKELNAVSGKCFYLGSTNETLSLIKKRIHAEYPKIIVENFSSPFKDKYDQNDLGVIIEKINNFKPDVVFMGLTAPKQEKLAHQIKDNLETGIICSIGAVFDFYAQTIQRPSLFLINMNLEWFGRFLTEPRRLWKRYFYFGFIFIFLILSKKAMSLSAEKSSKQAKLRNLKPARTLSENEFDKPVTF